MGVRLPSVASTTLVATTTPSTAETVVLTSPPINISLDFQLVLIFWRVMMAATGASTTAVTVRLRRGTSTAGTLVNIAVAAPNTAGTGFIDSGCYIDTPGAVAGQQYSISVAQTAGAASGTISDGCLTVMAL